MPVTLAVLEHLLSPVEKHEAEEEVEDTKEAHSTDSGEEQQEQGQPEGVPDNNNLREH